ncbi:MAG: type IV pilus twitching motility protein PilT [Elusimicrobiota bacterium]
MKINVAWTRCRDNEWGNLFAVDLGHAHFNDMSGVYVIWRGGEHPAYLSVGFGNIRDTLGRARKDPAILVGNDRNVYVTWANVDPSLREGVAAFLSKTLLDKSNTVFAQMAAVEINLPGDDAVSGAKSPAGDNLPGQAWQDMVARSNAPTEMKPVSPPIPAQRPKAQLQVLTDIVEILERCFLYNASDILLIPDEPPLIRQDGAVIKLPGTSVLPSEECKKTIYSMLTEQQRAKFEANGELDCSFSCSNIRYRVNVYLQSRGVAAALRMISAKIPTPEQIGLPPGILRLASMPRGLVLVTGPTGSGKTTTLASIIDWINQKQKKHIVTIEDPIEFVFKNKLAVIDQREVGHHTSSFAQALKYTLRQNPDVILIGEMRDAETADLAIRAAETGHLCFSTLHTQDAPTTIDRIISEFPAEQRMKLCNVLANVLVGVVSQVLLRRKDGGRVCAREIMIMNSAIGSLLRDDKVHQIRSALESGGHDGMMTLDQSLALLVKQGTVTFEEATSWARSPRNLKDILGYSH